jgi:hypothetical protein
MVELFFRHIFSRFLNAQEGNLYRLLALATPEGRMFYRARFLTETNEFQHEPRSAGPLGLKVNIEDATMKAITIANEHKNTIGRQVEETRNRLREIRLAVGGSESSGLGPMMTVKPHYMMRATMRNKMMKAVWMNRTLRQSLKIPWTRGMAYSCLSRFTLRHVDLMCLMKRV